MEGNLLKNDKITAEYRFAKDLVNAVFEMQTAPNFNLLQPGNTILTTEKKAELRQFFTKESPRLDKLVDKFTKSWNYGDRQFLLCVAELIEEYKPELKSEEKFLLICSRIAYITESFLRMNGQSLKIAVDRVYEIIIDTFYPQLNENGSIIKDIRDGKYRFAYDLIKILLRIRGIPVPDLELPNNDLCLFTSDHKKKVKELLERPVLDEGLASFIHKNGYDIHTDNDLKRFMETFSEFRKQKKIKKVVFVLKCATLAYSVTILKKINSKLNAFDLTVDFIHQMVKETNHFNIYDQDNDYRFACDLVKTIAEMRNNYFSFAEMSHSCRSFFMIAHRNKIEDLLSKERRKLEDIVVKFANKGKHFDYSDKQFKLCIDYILNDYAPVYKSKEELVHTCARLAYVSACFLREKEESNASKLAMDRMLEIVQDIDHLPNSTDKHVQVMRSQDDHFRFAYDLVRAVLKMKCVPVSDIDIPDPDNFLFTDLHRNKIEELFSKESPKLDKVVKKFTNVYGILDYSDNTFLQCMHEVMKKFPYDRKTEDGLVFISAIIGYLSACFSKHDLKSNAPFLAVNRIYEMIKEFDCFSNSTKEQVLIAKTRDDDYRFAYDLTTLVFEVRGIPLSRVDMPAYKILLFTDTCRTEIQDILSKDAFLLNEMVEKLTKEGGCLDYSDHKFVHCMNQIAKDYQPEQDNSFLYLCTKIAYTATVFLEENCRSNSIFLAINRIHGMRKELFREKMEDSSIKDDYRFSYDMVHAVLKLGTKSSFKIEILSSCSYPLTATQRYEIQDFLSKEWPRLHRLVRRYTKTCTAFSDSHFMDCMREIINENKPEQRAEKELLLVMARIAYVAICFLKKNPNSNAASLALDRIYQMRKIFYPPSEVEYDIYCFAHKLLRTVMEFQGESLQDTELPNPRKVLFKSQHRKIIKKLVNNEGLTMDKLVENLTVRDGNLDCSDDAYQRLIDEIIEENKREQENKKGLVRLFAKIAYPVSYFLANNKESNSQELALQRIQEMARSTDYFNEDIKLMNDVNDKYRLAEDLVKAVVDLLGGNQPNVKFPENCVLTSEHKRKMEDVFSKKGHQLDDMMKALNRKNRDADNSNEFFLQCMYQIIKKYKPECYTEDGFVVLCGRIAYVILGHFKNMDRFEATRMAARLAANQIYTTLK